MTDEFTEFTGIGPRKWQIRGVFTCFLHQRWRFQETLPCTSIFAFTRNEMEKHACERARPVVSMAGPIHDTWRFWSVVSLVNVGAWGCRAVAKFCLAIWVSNNLSWHRPTINRDSGIANYIAHNGLGHSIIYGPMDEFPHPCSYINTMWGPQDS